MITLLKSLRNINILIVIVVIVLIFMTLTKQPFYIFGFCLSCMASGYFYFSTNCIPIMIFSTLSFCISKLFKDNK